MIKLASDSDFKYKVLENDKAVLVDFYANWCGPCMKQVPILEDLANSRGLEYDIIKVNVEEVPKIINNYNINAIPTIMIFKNGKLKKRILGFMKREEINNIMSQQMV